MLRNLKEFVPKIKKNIEHEELNKKKILSGLKIRLESGEKLTEDDIVMIIKDPSDTAIGLLQKYSNLDTLKNIFESRIKSAESPEIVKKIEKIIDGRAFIDVMTNRANTMREHLETEYKIPVFLEEKTVPLDKIMLTKTGCHSNVLKLSMDILKKGEGIGPILAFKLRDGRHILIDGTHRFVSANILGIKEIPALVFIPSDKFLEPKIIADCFKDKDRKIPKTVDDITIMFDKEKKKISFAEFKELIKKELPDKKEKM